MNEPGTAGGERGAQEVVAVVAREHHQTCGGQLGPQARNQRNAVFAGKPVVDDHDVGRIGPDPLKRLVGVLGGPDHFEIGMFS